MPPRGVSFLASRATTGSVVGFPSSSNAQPSLTGKPSRFATANLPIAIVLVAMSKTNGGLRRVGAANAIGFVPNIFFFPKVGTTAEPGVPVIATPIKSCSNAILA